MGKSLIIKGADFSANGIKQILDITNQIGENWLCRQRNTDLTGTHQQSDNYKCCITQFDLSTIDGIENFSKIRITFNDSLNYVFGIGGADGFIRVAGIDTVATDFAWETDNHIGEISLDRATRYLISVNVRIGNGTTIMSATTPIEDCLKIILIP